MLLKHIVKTNWIKCSEQLPPENKNVLIIINDYGDNYVHIGKTNKNYWYDRWGILAADVLYWKALPELPQE